jgi:hypothetical protein
MFSLFCLLRVISARAIQPTDRPLSVVTPIATLPLQRNDWSQRAKRRHRGLFNQLVSTSDHGRRHGEAEDLGGLEVDDKFEFHGLLDR